MKKREDFWLSQNRRKILMLLSGIFFIVSFFYVAHFIPQLEKFGLIAHTLLYLVICMGLFLLYAGMLLFVYRLHTITTILPLSLLFFLPTELLFLFAVEKTNLLHYVFDIATVAYLIFFVFYLLRRWHAKNTIVKNTSSFSFHKEKSTLLIVAFFALVYFIFGFVAIGEQVNVDEPLWAYERVEKYWSNIFQRDWLNTRPSDKPGVTVSLLSGIALVWFDPDAITENTYVASERKELFFLALRTPLLLVTALALPLFFILLRELFSRRAAVIAIALIATSPVLLGMSRIVNPDALLWVFFTLTFLSYLAWRKTSLRRYFYLCGLSLGMGLLTKYVANIFFVLLPLLIIIEPALWQKTKDLTRYFKEQLIAYGLLVLSALATFTLLFPGVWVKKDRYLLATIHSQAFESVWHIFLIMLAAWIIDVFFLHSFISKKIVRFLVNIRTILTRASGAVLSLWIIGMIFAARLYDHSTLESIFASPKSALGFVSQPTLLFLDFFPLVFGVSVIALLGVLLASLYGTFKKKTLSATEQFFLFLLVLLLLFYYVGSIAGGISATVRYQISLYPLLLILGAIGINAALTTYRQKYQKIVHSFFLMIFIFGVAEITFIHPHYLSYANLLLPQNHSINPKDMGDGAYEAAQFLNALPDAQTLSVWSDKRGVCAFFVGTCASNLEHKTIIRSNLTFDYYVISSGRQARVRNMLSPRLANTSSYLVRFDVLYDIMPSDPRVSFSINPAHRDANYVRVIDGKDITLEQRIPDKDIVRQQRRDKILSFFDDKKTCDITDYGAVQNDQILDTAAIKKAITACAGSGGTVVIPNGTWHTGAIHMQSNTRLHLEDRARIEFSPNPKNYLPPVFTRFVGIELYNYSPLIYAKDCSTVAITGTGTLVGNGEAWWDFLSKQNKTMRALYKDIHDNDIAVEKRIFATPQDALRPSFIQTVSCEDVVIKDVRIEEGPMWTVHPLYSRHVYIDNIDVKTTGPNTDGIVIDSSQNVLIDNVRLSTGDDGIVIKSGRDKDGWRVDEPSENIIIKNCTIDGANSAVAIGSEMSGNVRDVSISDCTFKNTDRGIRIKTSHGRGGYVRYVRANNITMTGIIDKGIEITARYGSSTIRPRTDKAPEIRHIDFSNIDITMHNNPLHEKQTAIVLHGNKNTIIKDINLSHIRATGSVNGAAVENTHNVTFSDTQLSAITQPLFNVSENSHITLP